MCTFDRARTFADFTAVDPVRSELLRTSESYGAEIIAYCFMPDHLHFLMVGIAEDSDLLGCIRMFRQRSGHAFRAVHPGRLWQEGYVDRFLRSEEATIEVARYVVGNPIKGGLCSDLSRYLYWGSSRYSIEELTGSLA